MSHSQELRLASRLESFAPCINSVNWAGGAIDSIEYDRLRIAPRFLESLRRLASDNGFRLIAR